jgi:hypothetical protein
MSPVVKKTVVQVLCDWCGLSREGVEKRTIHLPAEGRGGRQLSFDACPECRSTVSLSEWETLLPAKVSPNARTTRKNRVVSVEEVEALARKRPRKKVG